jgi:transposase
MAKKGTVGQPGKSLTEEQIAEIEHLAKGMTVQQIAEYFDMGESTFHKLKAKNDEIHRAYKKYRAKTHNFVVNRLFDVISGNTNHTFPAIAFYLKTQSRWQEKQDVELAVGDNVAGKLLIQFADSKKDIENSVDK